MIQDQIAKLLLEKNAVALRPSQPFRFASGILSPIYCDNRLLLSDVEGRGAVIEAICAKARETKAEQIAGVATAGIAWGGWVAERLRLPFIYVRAAAKDHGKKKLIEGNILKVPTLLVEDLVSTGGSVLQAADELKSAGVPVLGVCAIFSYGFREAAEAFNRRSVPLHTLTDFEALLDTAKSLGKIGDEEAREILRWRKDPRNWAAGPA